MFSDRYRWLKIAFLLAFIALSCFYSALVGEKKLNAFYTLLDNPGLYTGSSVPLDNSRVIKAGATTSRITNAAREFEIHHAAPLFKAGQHVSLMLELREDKAMYVIRYHIHKKQSIKIVISVVAMFAVLGAFLWRYTFDFKNLYFRSRF